MLGGSLHFKLPRERRSGEDSMRQDGVDLRGSGLHELVGGQADGAAGVGHVVNLNMKGSCYI